MHTTVDKTGRGRGAAVAGCGGTRAGGQVVAHKQERVRHDLVILTQEEERRMLSALRDSRSIVQARGAPATRRARRQLPRGDGQDQGSLSP